MVNMYRVAKEALPYVKKAYTDLLNKSRLSSTDAESGEFGLDDHELYLYVYDNGEWIIDRAKYLQNHRSIASTAWIADYSSIRDLAEELKQNRVWE